MILLKTVSPNSGLYPFGALNSAQGPLLHVGECQKRVKLIHSTIENKEFNKCDALKCVSRML